VAIVVERSQLGHNLVTARSLAAPDSSKGFGRFGMSISPKHMKTFHPTDNWLKVVEFILLVIVTWLSPDNHLFPILVRLIFQILELWEKHNPPMP
jgi:hypothetical protein